MKREIFSGRSGKARAMSESLYVSLGRLLYSLLLSVRSPSLPNFPAKSFPLFSFERPGRLLGQNRTMVVWKVRTTKPVTISLIRSLRGPL